MQQMTYKFARLEEASACDDAQSNVYLPVERVALWTERKAPPPLPPKKSLLAINIILKYMLL